MDIPQLFLKYLKLCTKIHNLYFLLTHAGSWGPPVPSPGRKKKMRDIIQVCISPLCRRDSNR